MCAILVGDKITGTPTAVRSRRRRKQNTTKHGEHPHYRCLIKSVIDWMPSDGLKRERNCAQSNNKQEKSYGKEGLAGLWHWQPPSGRRLSAARNWRTRNRGRATRKPSGSFGSQSICSGEVSVFKGRYAETAPSRRTDNSIAAAARLHGTNHNPRTLLIPRCNTFSAPFLSLSLSLSNSADSILLNSLCGIECVLIDGS